MKKPKLKKDGTPSKQGEGGGRPMKIDKWCKKLEEILKDPCVAVMTDEGIVTVVNNDLEEIDQITLSCFEKWKARDWESVDLNNDQVKKGKRFLRVYKKALHKAQQVLLEGVMYAGGKDDKWQSKAWILERKFDEWNLKKKVDQNTKHGGDLGIIIKSNIV